MRLSEATALVQAEIREHDPQEDIEALCGLAEQAQQFSPIVGLEQLDKKLWSGRWLLQPEGLLLDVTGIPQLFGGEVGLLEAVSDWLRRQHLFGCLGLAASVGAAWALANYRTRQADGHHAASTAQNVEAIADELPACRYCWIPDDEDHEAAVANLPLAGLRQPPETIASLHKLGIHRIGDLGQLPRAGMATRLGENLLERWDQAAGRKREPIVSLHSSPDWNLEQVLEYPTQNRDSIAEIVRRLSRELSTRLNRRGEGGLRLVCRLDFVQRPPLVLQLGLFRPTNDAGHLEMLLVGQLEQQLRHGTAAPLWRLSLQATLTAPLVWRQADLFDGGESVGRQEFARLVDTLSSRLGRKNVLSAKVRRDAQPELACEFQPMTGRRADGEAQDTIRKLSSRLARQQAEPTSRDPMRRPTQLLSPPAPIQVVVHQPADSDTCPIRFQYQNVWHVITAYNGPERLESGWWRGPSTRRDYFRVISQRGSWWWIYRDLTSGKWYLHGCFD